MVDKEGNVIKPPKLMSALGRVGSLIAGALSFDKAYGAGKKGLGKAQGLLKKLRMRRRKMKSSSDHVRLMILQIQKTNNQCPKVGSVVRWLRLKAL